MTRSSVVTQKENTTLSVYTILQWRNVNIRGYPSLS